MFRRLCVRGIGDIGHGTMRLPTALHFQLDPGQHQWEWQTQWWRQRPTRALGWPLRWGTRNSESVGIYSYCLMPFSWITPLPSNILCSTQSLNFLVPVLWKLPACSGYSCRPKLFVVRQSQFVTVNGVSLLNSPLWTVTLVQVTSSIIYSKWINFSLESLLTVPLSSFCECDGFWGQAVAEQRWHRSRISLLFRLIFSHCLHGGVVRSIVPISWSSHRTFRLEMMPFVCAPILPSLLSCAFSLSNNDHYIAASHTRQNRSRM